MRSSIATIIACLVTVTVNGQYGQGGFFSFNRGPFYQPTGAFRPPFSTPFFPSQQPLRPPAFVQPGLSAGGCVPYPNYQSGGRSFWISWRDCGTQFRGDQVPGVCASGGMVPVSLDDPILALELMDLSAVERQKYFWTGGILSPIGVSWPNGVSQSVYELANFFSHTGGHGRPQPDNREGNESCLAVLNNFYNDGVRFHDVSCHHMKPTICEALAY